MREAKGNGVAERFIRTLKEQLLWVERFRTLAEFLEALHTFKDRYNREWLVAKHDHRSPAEARALLTTTVAA